MPSGFSTDFKELVRSRTDLVDLVGETVSLDSRGGGRDYVGLCPFHDDHKPSLHVYPERQSYRCWVCDEGGDCFSWVMGLEKIGFREALESLARRANVEVPRSRSGTSDKPRQSKNRLYEVLAWAEAEFHCCLLKTVAGAPARKYLAERGFTGKTIAQFRVGFHPQDWEWLLSRARDRFTPEQLLAARLVRERREGSGYYDDFVNRVLFPIRDERGRPVAFGGRVLPGLAPPDAPKYLNSPESEVFAKSRLLFGFDLARDAIRKSKTAVVVEGYTDCMMAHQYGLVNVIGTLGTALTDAHVRGLKRFARQVVLVYDGDEAGRMAAERALVKFLSQEVDLRILTLAGDRDPADFLEEQGREAFQKQVDQAPEAWDYKLRTAIDRYGLEALDARQRVLEEMLEMLSQVPRLSGTVREDMMLGSLSRRLAVPEPTVRQRYGEQRRRRSRGSVPAAGSRVRIDAADDPLSASGLPTKANKQDLLECELLEVIFAAPEWIEHIQAQVSAEDFTDDHRRHLLEACYRLAERGVAASYERVTAELEERELKRLAVHLDELARDQGITRKLQADAESRGIHEPPKFLQQLLRSFVWRRQERMHQLSKGRMAQRSSEAGGSGPPGSGLDPNDKELLRSLSEYHQQRAIKNTLT